jgi:tRNA pseudouridine55 synthase
MANRSGAEVHGILLLDKPIGLSSAAAVAHAKRLYGARKAGHTGSLDPLATGMLPICFGEATKFGGHLLEADKTYQVTMRLGERTPSADLESEVVERRTLPTWSVAEITAALAAFPRDYLQMPPMHSALKHEGKPLYAYARAGQWVARAPRALVLRDIQLQNWRSPDLEFVVCCSKGTYIRVLVVDLAASMGTIGHMTQLRRLSVAPFEAERLRRIAELEAMSPVDLRHCLLAPDAAIGAWPRVEVPASRLAPLLCGQSIPIAGVTTGPVRIYAPDGSFLGTGDVGRDALLVPRRLRAVPSDRA